MEEKEKIVADLIARFGKKYNTIDSLKIILDESLTTKYYYSIAEYLNNSLEEDKSMSIEDYTSGYITSKDRYIIITLVDKENNIDDVAIVVFDKKSKKILKYSYSGRENKYLYIMEAFV